MVPMARLLRATANGHSATESHENQKPTEKAHAASLLTHSPLGNGQFSRRLRLLPSDEACCADAKFAFNYECALRIGA